MSYTRVNWNSTTTYVSAENLNVMDKGIKDLDTNIGDVTTLTTTAKTVVPAIKELKTGLDTVNNNLTTVDISEKLVANAGITIGDKQVTCTGNSIIIQCVVFGLGSEIISDKPIATLDAMYRPKNGYYGFVCSYDGSGNNKIGIAYITTDGVVAISFWGAAYAYNRIQIQLFK